MPGHLLKPCKSKAAFEALPHIRGGRLRLDLTKCSRSLGEIGYLDVCDAKVLLIMKKDLEVTIYPSGKLLLKTDSKTDAQTAMVEIYDVILPK